MTYGLLVRPFLKFLDSENAHTLSLKIGSKVASTLPGQKMLGSLYRTPSLPINAFGLGFRHPLGLAAGMDKKCEAKGLIVRPLINMCVFSPPLTITIEQIGEMFDIIEESLVEVSNEML